MQHQNIPPHKSLSATRSELFRWQLTLFNPSFKPGQQVSHTRIKANSFKHRANKEVSIIMPVCMDRTSGKQLFAPENMARLLCLATEKLTGVKVNITILLTGELCAWNTLRRENLAITAESLAAARNTAAQHAKLYEQAITPIVNELAQAGHVINFRHWADVYTVPMIATLTQHLLERYQVDPNYTKDIDFALAKFYMRQQEQGESTTAKFAKKYNIQYITEELAYAIYTYVFENGRYDFQLYEYDDLSPKLAEAALLTCKDFLAKNGHTVTNFGAFMLEYKQQELDTTAAEYKKAMQTGFANMEQVFATKDYNQIGRYRASCKKMQLVVSTSEKSRCFSLTDIISNGTLDIESDNERYRMTELPDHHFQLIPGVGIRTLVVEGRDLERSDHFHLLQTIESSLISIQYFTIYESSFNHLNMATFKSRLSRDAKTPLNCLVAVFPLKDVCLRSFSRFEEIAKSHPPVTEVLYFGITNTELKKLQAAIKDMNPADKFPTCTVKLMSRDEKKKQLQKFLYHAYNKIPEANKELSTMQLKSSFATDDHRALLEAIGGCDVKKVKMFAAYNLDMNMTGYEKERPLIHAMSTEISLRMRFYHTDQEHYDHQCKKLQEIIAILIQAGAIHKEAIAPFDAYPLECAATNNCRYSFQALLGAGYDIFDATDADIIDRAYGQALSHKTQDREIIRALEMLLPPSCHEPICPDRKFC